MFYTSARAEDFSGADLDNEAADRIDPSPVAGIEHRGRRDFLEDGRPGNLVAGEQRFAAPDGDFPPRAAARSFRLEIDPADAVARLGRGLTPAGGRLR